MKKNVFLLFLTLTCFLSIVYFFTYPFSLLAFDNNVKISEDISMCQLEYHKAGYVYDHLLSTNMQKNFAREDFIKYFEETYPGCFSQCNPLISGTNTLVSSQTQDKPIPYTLSDDVCGSIKMDIVFETNQWKISRLDELMHKLESRCTTTLITSVPSPNGKNKIIAYDLYGGGSAGFKYTEISLVPINYQLASSHFCHTLKGTVLESYQTTINSISWNSDNNITISLEKPYHIMHQLNQYSSTEIIYIFK